MYQKNKLYYQFFYLDRSFLKFDNTSFLKEDGPRVQIIFTFILKDFLVKGEIRESKKGFGLKYTCIGILDSKDLL